jgi:hypothetical protein
MNPAEPGTVLIAVANTNCDWRHRPLESSGGKMTNAGFAKPLVEPAGGAGLFDIDLNQDDLSQDPNVPIVGDVDALPEDMEL